MKKYISIISFTAALAACSGSGTATLPTDGSKNGQALAASPTPIISQPIIENEDLTAGLKGADVNNNGIRDDIDRLIAKKYSNTPAIQNAAEQKARSLQHLMESTTKQLALAAADENARAWACVRKRLPFSDPANTKIVHSMTAEIESLTANTKERFTKYWGSNKLIAGGYFSQAVEPVCD